ncbi:MAG: trypsin-like peptidase domain-containing protein [Candidatus Pacebacteria bacterium]|nr:trypsin-like peptidase domain-containing protein [Candidatus Paceibacterota bacterium]
MLKSLKKIKCPFLTKKHWTTIALIIVVFSLSLGVGTYLIKNIKPYWDDFLIQTGILKNQAPIVNLPVAVSPYNPQTTQEEATINVVKNATPAVVSIIISKEVPVYEQYIETQPFSDFFGGQFQIQIPQMRQKGTELQTVGEGTGFIVSSDGMVLTNKHVVSEKDAFYKVVLSNGESFEAKVLATDPLQDLAVIKIQPNQNQSTSTTPSFPVLFFGNSDAVVVGQTAIAIGNALGEFSNSVSVGVISGLGRSITASGGGVSETLENIFQTDAAINKGNSGGPLLNLKGEVIGINAAMAEGAVGIGFAIPANRAKRDIRQAMEQGKISYAFLGIRYALITPELQQAQKLSVDYGALISQGDDSTEPAVVPGSAAAKAGIKEGDIILFADGMKISTKNPLSKIIQDQHLPGDKIVFKVLRNSKEITLTATLDEKKGD